MKIAPTAIDQLAAYFLKNYPRNFTAPDRNTSLLIWSKRGTGFAPLLATVLQKCRKPYFKVAFNHAKKKISFDDANTFQKFCIIARTLSKELEIPFGVIRYCGAEDGSVESNGVNVLILNPNGEVIVNGHEDAGQHAQTIRKILNAGSSAGTFKPENSRLGDPYHLWSRANLPGEIIKFDIDGMFYDKDAERVILEIKRSGMVSLENWKPYPNDEANYRLLFNVARGVGSEMWVIHHLGIREVLSDDEKVQIYRIDMKKDCFDIRTLGKGEILWLGGKPRECSDTFEEILARDLGITKSGR